MNFKKLFPTGLVVAAGLMTTVSVAQANTSTTLIYESQNLIPKLKATIDDGVTDAFTVTLSTSLGTADYLGFGFNWNSDVYGDLNLSNFHVESAYAPPGTIDLETGQTAGVQIYGAGTTTENAVPLTFGLCSGDATSCKYVEDNQNNTYEYVKNAGGANNFNGNGSATTFDYIFALGVPGTGGNDYIDEVTFKITLEGQETHLNQLTGDPFSQVAARAQSALDLDENNAGTDDEGSIKGDLVCTNCGSSGEPGEEVPEIDGPVLIQVGFALGGLYLMLLGRRRREDEPGQMV